MTSNIEEDESILNSGIQSIIDAFKIQSDKYNSIINSLNQKIDILQSQNEQLKIDNEKYISQIEALKGKLNAISSTAIVNDKDDESSFIYNHPPRPTLHASLSKRRDSFLLSHPNTVRRPISNNPSFFTSRTNQSNRTDVSKYTSIQNRINTLRNVNSSSSMNHSRYLETYSNIDDDNEDFLNNNTTNGYNHTYFNTSMTNRDRLYNKENTLNRNKSQQYQKTSKFLRECKLLLNASNFEKLIKVFKDNSDGGSTRNKRVEMKIKDLLQNNTKLLKLYSSLYN